MSWALFKLLLAGFLLGAWMGGGSLLFMGWTWVAP